jgi:hypothetical protein
MVSEMDVIPSLFSFVPPFIPTKEKKGAFLVLTQECAISTQFTRNLTKVVTANL